MWSNFVGRDHSVTSRSNCHHCVSYWTVLLWCRCIVGKVVVTVTLWTIWAFVLRRVCFSKLPCLWVALKSLSATFQPRLIKYMKARDIEVRRFFCYLDLCCRCILLLLFCLAIFGQSLERTLQYEQRGNKLTKVPHIVECCVTYLRNNGLHEEGLFRWNIVVPLLLLQFKILNCWCRK